MLIATTPPSSTTVTVTESICLCSWFGSIGTKICINTDCMTPHPVCFLSTPFTVTAFKIWLKVPPDPHYRYPALCVFPVHLLNTNVVQKVSFCNWATFQTRIKANEALTSYANPCTEPVRCILRKLWSSEFYTEFLFLYRKAHTGALLKNGNQLFWFVQLLLYVTPSQKCYS